jgi:hypothetical protein
MKHMDFSRNGLKLRLKNHRGRVFRACRRLPQMFSCSKSGRLTCPVYTDRKHPCRIRGTVSCRSPRRTFCGARNSESRIAAEDPWHMCETNVLSWPSPIQWTTELIVKKGQYFTWHMLSFVILWSKARIFITDEKRRVSYALLRHSVDEYKFTRVPGIPLPWSCSQFCFKKGPTGIAPF